MLQHSSQVLEVLLVLSELLVHRRDRRARLRLGGRHLLGDARFTPELQRMNLQPQLEQQNQNLNQSDEPTN